MTGLKKYTQLFNNLGYKRNQFCTWQEDYILKMSKLSFSISEIIPQFSSRTWKIPNYDLWDEQVINNMKNFFEKSDDALMILEVIDYRLHNKNIGTTTQKIVFDQVLNRIKNQNRRYDFDNMSFTKLKSVYKQRTGSTFEDTDYESFGLIDEKGNLTNAGALLADESPVRHSRLFCTRWNGLTKASGIMDALDDKEYTGSLVTLLQAGTDFVRNNSKKAWRKVGDGRIEMPDYPDRAVLEGVVNALIHRNYMEIGSEVHIDMFDDRIEIYSPGGMVSGISLEGKNLLKIPSKRRNPILADIFSRLKYMERRGSGFKKILADYEGQVEFDETKMPVFDADNDDFTLTLYNLNYGTNYATQVNENVIENVIEISEEKMKQLMPEYSKKKLTKACEILKMISENPNISIDELRIALDVTDRTIARYISELKDKGIIERKGPDNGGKWKIK